MSPSRTSSRYPRREVAAQGEYFGFFLRNFQFGILLFVCGILLGPGRGMADNVITNTNTNSGWDQYTNAGWNTSSNNPWNTNSGTNNEAYFTNTSGGIAVTNVWLNALNEAGTNGSFQIGLSVGQGTLNFVGTNPWIYTTNGSETLTIDSALAIGSNIAITNNANLSLAGVVSGSGTLTQSGTGTLTLSASNSYSGGTRLNAGTVDITTNAAFGSGAVTLASNAAVAALTNLNVTNNFTINSGTATLSEVSGATLTNSGTFSNVSSLIISGPGNVIFSGVLSGSGSLTQSATGTLTLSASNNYSGSTFLDAGTVDLGTNNSFGSGTVTFASNATVASLTNVRLTNTFVISSNATATFNEASGLTLTNTGNISNNAGLVFSGAGNMSLNGIISGSGSLTQSATGTLSLSASNNFSGGTFLDAGTVDISTNAAFGTGTVTFVSNAVVNDVGYNMGVINNMAINSNATATFIESSVVLTNFGMISGSGSLIQGGSGNLLLTATNIYTGVTAISGGVLEFLGTNSLYGGNSNLWTASNLIVSSGATIGFGVGTSAGGNAFTTTNITTLLGNLTSATNNSNGILAGASIGFDSSGTNFILTNNLSDSAGSGGGSLGLTKLGGGTLTITGVNTFSGTTLISGGTLLLSGSAVLGNGTYSANITNKGALVDASSANQTLGGVISGSGSITLSGSSTLTLTASNSYSGGTLLDAGTVDIGTNGVFGSGSITFASNATVAALTNVRLTNTFFINSNAVATLSELSGSTLTNSGGVTNNGGLVLSGSGNLNLTGTISGTGSLTQSGSGTLSLSTFNNFSGGTFLDAGTVSMSTNGVLGYGSITFLSNAMVNSLFNMGVTNNIAISSNATATFSEASTILTNSGLISGAGSLVQSGGGTLILSGSNSYSGTTLVSGGVMLLNGTNSGGGSVIVTNTATLGGSGTTTGAVTVNSGASITPGSGVTPGSMTIGGLTLNTGSVLNVLLGSGTSSLLTVTGSATLGGTLSFSASGLSNSTYTFLTDSNGYSGTFALITNLPSNYQLIYGSNSVYLQTNGTLLGTLTTSFAGTNAVITGGTTNFFIGLSNSGSSGNFVFTATNGSNTAGVIGSTTLTVGSATNAAGMSFTGTTVGSNQTGSFSVSETAPATNSTNASVLVNVYGHASGALATNVVVLSNAIVGYSGALNGSVGVSNSAGFRVALLTASTSTNTDLGITDINGLTNGGYTNLVLALSNQGMGVYSNSVAVTFGDSSSLNGAVTNLSTTNFTVTGTIYGHASGALATNEVTMVSVHAGYTNTLSNNLVISNAAGLLAALQESATSSATNLSLAGIVSLAAGSSTNVALTLASGQGVGSYTDTVTVTFGDASGLNGAVTNLSTTNLTVIGLVYSGQSTWAAGSGNWTNFANWNANGGTPGLSGYLSSNDTATFNTTGLTSGVGTVTLNTNASLMALTFSNALASYNVAGSGTITMQAGSNQAVIFNLAGSNSITTSISLPTNLTVNSFSGSQLTLGGPIAGTGGLTFAGAGTVSLAASNSYYGGTFLDAGTVDINSNGAFGSGTVTFSSNATVAALTNGRLTNIIIVNSNAVATFSEASGATLTNSGNISNNASLILSGSGNLNVTGIIGGAGSLTQSGTGTLTLSAFNSYTGATYLDAGTVSISNNWAFGYGSITFASNAAVSSYAYMGLSNNIAISSNSTAAFSETSGVLTNSGVISGAGSLAQSGNGTLILSGNNTYSGTTIVSGGLLQLNGANTGGGAVTVTNTGTLGGSGTTTGAVTVNSGGSITPGNGIAPGILTIGGLTLNTGSVFNVLISNGTSSLLTVNGSATLGGTLSISASGLTNSSYTFLTDTNGYSGTFALTTNLPSNYQLVYGSNSVYLQSAVSLLGTLTTSFAGTNAVITGGTTNFFVGLSNNSSSGNFVFTASSGSNTTGMIGSTTLTVGSATNATGLSFTGTTVGSNQAGSFSVSETAPATNSTNTAVLVNVYGHAAGALATNVINFPSAIVGYSTFSTNLVISNAAGLLVALQATSTSTNSSLSLAGVGSLTPGSSTNAALTFTSGQGVGIYTNTVAVTFGDASSLNGAVTNLSTTNVTVIGTIYGHASGSLATNVVSMLAVHAGYTNTLTNNLLISNAAGLLVALQESASSSATNLSLGSITALSEGSSTNVALTLSPGQALGSYTDTVTVTFGDASGLNGAVTNLSTTNLTVIGVVYSGQSTWTAGSGNWTNLTNWNISGGTPGLSGTLSSNDTATFNTTGLTSGVGTVTLNTNASLMTLTISNASASYNLAGSGTITMKAGSNQPVIANLAGSNSITTAIGLATNVTVTDLSGSQLTLGGSISGAGGLTLAGLGVEILSNSNSYYGGTFLDAGTIYINTNGAFGSGSISFVSNATVSALSNLSVTNAVTINSNATATIIESSGVTLSLNGAISNNSSLMLSGTGNLNLAGSISGAGSLTQSGYGTMTLAASNSYHGGTFLNAGTLAVGTNSAFGSGTVTFVSNAVVNDLTYMSFSNNFVINSNATATFTEASTLMSNAGVISGLGTLAQGGGGTLALSGSNTYSGGTLLEGGTLVISTNIALGTGSITFASNATLTSLYYMGVTNNISINSNATATFTQNSYSILTNSGVISGLGSLAQSGGGTLTLSGSNSYSGGTVVTGGTLTVSNTYALGSTNGSLLVASGLLYNTSFNTKVGAVTLGNGTISGPGTLTANNFTATNSAAAIITESLAGSGSLTKSGGGTLTLIGSNTYAGATTLLGGTLEFMNTGSLYAGNSTNWNASNLIVSSGATVGFGVGINAGSNAFTTSNITSLIGNLTSVTNTNSGLLAGASIGIDPTGTYFTLTNNLSNSGGIGGGALGLAKLGSGTLNLTGNNTYTGSTLISGGGLQIYGSGLLGGGTYTANITNNGSLFESSSLNQTFSGVISGAGTLYEGGSNSTLNLSGDNTFSGVIIINTGTLELSGYGMLGGGSYATNINDNANFIDASSANQTLGGVISGSGSLSKIGTGTLILSGSNTYNGPTLISSGALLLNGTNSGGSAFTVTNTGTLGGSGRITGSLTVASGGTVTPGSGSTPGTLSIQSVIWNPGGNYNWQLSNASGSAGSGYASLSISSALNLSQLSSSNQFSINLWTLSGTNPLVSGAAANFNPYTNYSWNLASFGSITNFSSADFLINTNATNGTGGFANTIYGSFGIATNATNLVLTYTTVFASSTNSLYVGSNSSYNSTNFTSGPNGYSNAFVGFSSNASGNSLTVANTNTLLSVASQIAVGIYGSSNTFLVTNGGAVFDAVATIGSNGISTNNSVVVSGTNSIWSNSGSVTVGYLGGGTLTVANNGLFCATNLIIASQSNSVGVLNIGSLGGGDGAGTLSLPSISFGSGNGSINLNQSNAVTLGAMISGNGSVNQLGSGTTILAGSNSYSGPTLISSGTLLLEGTSGGSSAFTVTNSGTLGGIGKISGSLTIATGGTITPGIGFVSPGTLSVQSVLWSPGGNYNWQLSTPSGPAGSGYGTLIISGVLNLSQLSSSNQFNINLWTLSGTNPSVSGAAPGFNPYTNYSWNIASFGSITNFSSSDFLINTGATNGAGGFANSLYGSFAIATNSTNLILTYTTALAPSTNWLYVGSNTPNNSSNFTSGAVGYSNAYVGYQTNASSNSLLVANTNTVLAVSGSLIIGYSGSANTLVVSNGGIVADAYSYIGLGSASSNNSVLISGGNSVWTNTSQIFFGSSGTGNSLVISNGGKVSDSTVYMGMNSTSSNNSALISGSNSLWTNSLFFVVGVSGGGNKLVITNGGVLTDFIGFVGSNTSFNNSVVVSGSNSAWINTGTVSGGYTGGGALTVGNLGGGTLTVANGGIVTATNLFLASQSNSIGVINIGSLGGSDGAGTLNTPFITFGNGNGTINFNQSNTAIVGATISGNGSVNQLGSGTTILSGSNSYSGPTLISSGTLLLNGTNNASSAFGVTNSGTFGGSGKIIGTLTVASGGTITPGSGSTPGTLSLQSVIWNGGGNYNWQVANPSGSAGSGYSTLSISSTLNLSQLSSSNQFNINLWTLSGTNPLTSGAAASFNPNLSQSWTLASVLGGIVAFNTNDFTINTTATNGTGGFVNPLNGSFAISTNGSNILLNYTSLGGTNASITIGSNSANVSTNFSSGTTNIGSLYIGLSPTSTNNSVTISGAGTVLSGSGDVVVGNGGSGNSLVITNGAVLQNANGYVDDGPGSSNNSVVVNGSGSTWVSQTVTVGTNGNNNSLIVTNGGSVLSSNGVISDAAVASNNYALITGVGSVWNNSGTITVGNAGGGTLTVANGGTVSAANIVIASQAGSAGTLNVGTLGGNDSSGFLLVNGVAFGSGSGSLNFNQSDTATVAGSISGNGVVSQLGSGTTVLTGSNTYSGVTAINAGTLQIGSGGISGGLGSSSVTNNASLVFDLGGTSVVASPITGPGALSQIGGGTLILSGSNSYSGVTTIQGGTLEFLGTNSLYNGNSSAWTALNIVVSSNGTIAFGVGTNEGAFTAANVSTLLGNLTNNGAGAAIGFDASGTNFILTNNIADTTGVGALALATMGTGTLTLTGSNSYSGETLVNGGTLSISATSNLGAGVLLLSSNTVFQYTGAGGALANSIQVASGTGVIENIGGGMLTLSGSISKQNSILEFAGGSFNVTGQISGGSVGDNLFNSDLILSNSAVTLSVTNSYYGPTYLLAGSTLTDGINNAMPVTTILNIGGAGDPGSVTNALNLAGYSQSINGLTNAGSATAIIYDSVGGGTLTITGSSGFSGSIGGGGSFMDLAISGASTVVTLTGNNTYTGSTWISATLDLGATGQLSGTTNVVINGGTLLLGGNGKNNPVNTNAALTLNAATLSLGGLSATSRTASQTFASLTLTGNSTIDFGNLTGTSSLTFGTITMNGNSLSVDNYNGSPLFGAPSTTGGAGQYTTLYDLNTNSLSATDLANISFYSGNGTGFLGSGTFQGNEIIAVPEPAVIVAALLLLACLILAPQGRILFPLFKTRGHGRL